MAYAYTPTYYSSLHDSITSLCKSILPFSFKKRRLPAAEHKLAKLQSDNLKWQQDSFHQILNLMGLHKEGILSEPEVSAFRTHLLETLIASPPEREHPPILRDKLVFLQELLYAKCISEDEYHASKRPLLQRLAVQGAEIEARDVIVGGRKIPKENSDEVWSVIDLKDEQCAGKTEVSNSKNKSKHISAFKQIKGAASVLSYVSPHKPGKSKEEKSIFDSLSDNLMAENPNASSCASANNDLGSSRENPFWKESETKSILMQEGLRSEPAKECSSTGKVKRKAFRNLFHRAQREGQDGGDGADDRGPGSEERMPKSARRPWGLEGFRKWKKNDSEDETAPLQESLENEAYLVDTPIGEGPDTKQLRKLHRDGSSSNFFIDKVLGERIKKELSRIQTELCTTNPNLKFSDAQMETIATKLPVNKADLNKFFPKSWCDRYGDVVLDVVKKEFKDHVGEMDNMRRASKEKRSNSIRWTTFDDDENCNPNFAHNDSFFSPKQHDSNEGGTYRNFYSTNSFDNPFLHASSNENKLSSQGHNPFWAPSHGSSLF